MAQSDPAGGPPGPQPSPLPPGQPSFTRELARAVAALIRWMAVVVRGEVVKRVGGPARARVITLFGVVLALNGADTATVGAIAPQLERSLHIGNTKIGLLTTVSLLVAAVFTIPVGLMVDRFKRVPMLALSIVLWSIASMLSAFASSYSELLLTRLALGGVAATAGPAIASLTGDYFPARERGRVYAYILGGEIAGSAFGFIISGSVASLIDWRATFIVLGIPGFFLARELWRTVPEPLRGGQSSLQEGVVDLQRAVADSVARAAALEQQPAEQQDPSELPTEHVDLAEEAARRQGAAADPRLILREDPSRMSLSRAIRYVLSIPSNVMLIIGSSLGYFFFSGLSTFALLFVRGHYHASQAEAELALAMLVLGAIVGTLISGRLTDALLKRGMLESRVWVPAICYIAAALFLIPGFVSNHLTPALWFDVIGAAFISAANPPLDAARLDIVPAGLWGRAESTRTFLRSLAQALAPLLFGGVADLVAGFVPEQTPIGTHVRATPISHATATGLEVTFLIMLTTLVAAGVFLGRARHRYATDVATAAASRQAGRSSVDAVAPTRIMRSA